MPNIVSEYEPSGQLEHGPLDVQWQRMFQQVFGQDCGQAVVKIPTETKAFAVNVAWLKELWHGKAKTKAVELGKKMLMEGHSYTFVPPKDLEELTREHDALAAAVAKGEHMQNGANSSGPFDS